MGKYSQQKWTEIERTIANQKQQLPQQHQQDKKTKTNIFKRSDLKGLEIQKHERGNINRAACTLRFCTLRNPGADAGNDRPETAPEPEIKTTAHGKERKEILENVTGKIKDEPTGTASKTRVEIQLKKKTKSNSTKISNWNIQTPVFVFTRLWGCEGPGVIQWRSEVRRRICVQPLWALIIFRGKDFLTPANGWGAAAYLYINGRLIGYGSWMMGPSYRNEYHRWWWDDGAATCSSFQRFVSTLNSAGRNNRISLINANNICLRKLEWIISGNYHF